MWSRNTTFQESSPFYGIFRHYHSVLMVEQKVEQSIFMWSIIIPFTCWRYGVYGETTMYLGFHVLWLANGPSFIICCPISNHVMAPLGVL